MMPAHSNHLGRDADSPRQIPVRGWVQVFRRVLQQVSEDRVPSEAAAVTFYAILSLFPALGALVSIYGLVADPRSIQATLNGLANLLPSGGLQVVGDQLNAITSHPSRSLSLGAIAALLSTLWSANAGVKGLFDALNVVYGERESRSFIRRTCISMCFTAGGILFLVLVLAAVVALPVALEVLGATQFATAMLALIRWPLLFALVSVLLALIYRYGPSRAHARVQWVSWGSAIATIAWLAVSILFSFYVAHFGTYNKTYGSLGAAIGFMTWIWISTIVILIGAELNAELEHQTSRDSTLGGEKPMGHRHATMADEVAS